MNLTNMTRWFAFITLAALIACGDTTNDSTESGFVDDRPPSSEEPPEDEDEEPPPADDDIEEPPDTPAPLEAPTVSVEARYEVNVTTHVYGQGLTHESWGSEQAEPMDLMLDLYVPEQAPDNRPAIVMIHGGAFVGGDKTMNSMVNYCNTLAARGWVCASINYRLAGDFGTVPETWRQAIAEPGVPRKNQLMAQYPAGRDARAAIRWMHANAETYAINPDHIAVSGGSAGASIAVMTSVMAAEDFRDELSVDDDPTLASTNLDASSRVVAVVEHWGSGNMVGIYEQIYGVNRFSPDNPPLSIVHGRQDDTVLFTEAEALEMIYEANGVDFEFHELPEAGHGAWGAELDGQTLPDLAMDFLVSRQGLILE